jgi:peroxiredoxin
MNSKTILKGSLPLILMSVIGSGAWAQHAFTIKGQLGADKQGKIMMFYKTGGKFKSDTSTVTNGAFVIKGEVTEPGIATMYLNKAEKITAENRAMVDAQTFSLEAADIKVSGKSDLKSAKITGGKSQADYTGLMEQYAPIQQKMAVLGQQMAEYKKNLNDTAILRVEKEFSALSLQKKAVDSAFIVKKPGSYLAYDMWQKKHRDIIDPDIEPEFMHFTAAVRNTTDGKKMADRIAIAKKLSAGNMAPDFTLTDTLGKPVALSSFRGKNVMLCFWSTDFIGFDIFTFNMGRINRRLHDKNFVILGVYYNNTNKRRDDMEFIKSTIATAGMNWTTLTDLHGITYTEGAISPVAKAYGLSLIELPQAYLIGPDGKIIARHLHLEDKELGKKMEGMLK